MPLYRYKATTPDGQVLQGEMEGVDQDAVVTRIQQSGNIPIRVVPAAGRLGLRVALGARGRRRVSQRQVVMLAQELASLLQAGMPLDRSLDIAQDIAGDAPTRELVLRMRETVQAGQSLSDALENEREVFTPLQVSMVRAAESSGNLGTGLARLAEYLEKAQALRERVFTALIYPAALTAVAGLSLLIVLAYVVPKISELFGDAGVALPLSTRIVIGAADLLNGYWWLLVGLVVAAILYLRRSFARPSSRYRWDARALGAPILGSLIRRLETARFTRSMGTLVVNGVPVLSALSAAKGTLSNRVLAERLDDAADALKAGRGLAEPLAKGGVFPTLAVQMIKVGEETGQLGDMLLRAADIYDREASTAIQRLLGLIEPALIVGLGLTIGGIIISILTAIVSVNDLPI